MATFPSLQPATRTFTPGRHPHSEIPTLSGLQIRVRTSNVILDQRLRLTFTALTEAEMLSIRSHYLGQQGRFLSFAIPNDLLSGTTNPTSFTPTGYSWIYAERPQITDIGLQRYDVSIELATVPPEGANINGSELFATATFTAATAVGGAAKPGFDLTVTTAFEGGIVADNESAGLLITVTTSFVPGTADGGVAANDPFWSNVRLLVGGDSLPVTDESSFATPIGTNTLAPLLDTSTKKFGAGSLSFPGDANRDCEVANTNNNVDVGLYQPFTWECWVYFISASGVGRANTNAFMESQGGTDFIFGASAPSSGAPLRAFFIPANSTAGYYHQDDLALNTWHHFALVREPASPYPIYIYVNGVKSTTAENNGSALDNATTVGFTFGKRQSGTTYNFRLDEVRITIGTARYTANFTPPTAAFPRS